MCSQQSAMGLVTGCFLLALNVKFVSSQFSLFTKTKVIEDTCFSKVGMKETSSHNELDCMIICAGDPDCRRFMYCGIAEPSCTLHTDGDHCITPRMTHQCSCYKKKMNCIKNVCTCALGYYGDKCQHITSDCTAFAANTSLTKEILISIKPPDSLEPYEILCHPLGGWATILHKQFDCLPENFNRSMAEYEEGFGSTSLNAWIGFTKLEQLLNVPGRVTLNVVMVMNDDYTNCQTYYSNFSLTSKEMGYALNVNEYRSDSTCGDSMTDLRGNKFSTYDNDHTSSNECASRFGGGWWFSDNLTCSRSFLTGTMVGSGTNSYWLDDFQTRPIRRIQLRIYQ